MEVRQQLLAAIYAGQPFRTVLRDLGLLLNKMLPEFVRSFSDFLEICKVRKPVAMEC